MKSGKPVFVLAVACGLAFAFTAAAVSVAVASRAVSPSLPRKPTKREAAELTAAVARSPELKGLRIVYAGVSTIDSTYAVLDLAPTGLLKTPTSAGDLTRAGGSGVRRAACLARTRQMPSE